MVIQFSTSINELYNNKLHRYKELNSMYYMQQEMSNTEVLEWNKLENWLKLHNN